MKQLAVRRLVRCVFMQVCDAKGDPSCGLLAGSCASGGMCTYNAAKNRCVSDLQSWTLSVVLAEVNILRSTDSITRYHQRTFGLGLRAVRGGSKGQENDSVNHENYFCDMHISVLRRFFSGFQCSYLTSKSARLLRLLLRIRRGPKILKMAGRSFKSCSIFVRSACMQMFVR